MSVDLRVNLLNPTVFLLSLSPQGVSWVTVHYMLGEVQYGGRVTDDFDKRLLNTYARVWFSQEMFKETFKFYQGYNIPRCAQIADFKAHIDEMPLSDTPEVIDVYRNRVLFDTSQRFP